MATDADRYIYLISHFGLVDGWIQKWNVRRDKPLLIHLQDLIDKGVKEAGPEFIESQRKLLQ